MVEKTIVSETDKRKAWNQTDMGKSLFRNSEHSYTDERKCHILKEKRRSI